MRFTVVQPDDGFPLEIHRAGCRDSNDRRETAWDVEAMTAGEAAAAEADELNERFEEPYPTGELTVVMPCTKGNRREEE